MIENLWILKYKVMVMLNICNLIKLKPISKNPQRFTTRVISQSNSSIKLIRKINKLIIIIKIIDHII